MKPIPYNPKDMMIVELQNDLDGSIFEGEFLDMRIARDSIPEGKHAYDCRHDDDGNWIDPVTIENRIVRVNFCGTFITDKPIVFPDGKNYIPVTIVD